jgi:hypothetical protein
LIANCSLNSPVINKTHPPYKVIPFSSSHWDAKKREKQKKKGINFPFSLPHRFAGK